MRIIALVPVKNEAWILDRTLRSLSTFCDAILVADQQSADGTHELLRRYSPKVVAIDNPSKFHSTSIRWRLLDVAREYDGYNFLIFTDADEILSSNILEGNKLDFLASLQPGTSILIELVNLWRSPKMWRNDNSVWSRRWMQIGFRDNRHVQYRPIRDLSDHNMRIPECLKVECVDEIKLLHFQFVLFERMLSKQRHYRASEVLQSGRIRAEGINRYYCITRDERRVHFDPVKPEWTAGWKEIGIDLEHFEESPLYWYDVEVLRYFADKGPAYFASVDLWDADWEKKRKLAKAQGYEGIPDKPINDPRSLEQRLYHGYLHRFFRTPPWRDPNDLLRMPSRWLRGAIRSTGLRRRHLETLGFIKPEGSTEQGSEQA